MSELTVNVPDEMSEEVDAWANNEDYTITVRQTAPGLFDLVSTSAETEEAEPEAGEPEMKPGKKVHPQMTILIGGGGKMKA